MELGKRASSEDYLYVELLGRLPRCTCPWIACAPIFPTFWGSIRNGFPARGPGKAPGCGSQLLHHRTDDASIFEAFLKQICGLDPDAADRTCFCRQCAGRGRKHETNLCDHAGVWLLFEADNRGFPRAGGQSHLFDHRGDRRGKDHHPGRYVFLPLYCKATGGRRSWGSMRCAAARRARKPWSILSSSWRARRTVLRARSPNTPHVEPVRSRQRRTHACYRMEGGEWELLFSGAESRVREKAEEILGLTCEQFSQVIVLPQGDFLKLLLSSSRDKAQMFQTLFATGRWERAARNLKEMAAMLGKQAGELEAAKRSILEREGVGTLPLLEEKEAALREQLVQAKAAQEAAEKAFQNENAALRAAEALSERFAALSSSRPSARYWNKSRKKWKRIAAVWPRPAVPRGIPLFHSASGSAKGVAHKTASTCGGATESGKSGGRMQGGPGAAPLGGALPVPNCRSWQRKRSACAICGNMRSSGRSFEDSGRNMRSGWLCWKNRL